MLARMRAAGLTGLLAGIALALACAPAAGAQGAQTRIVAGSNVRIEDHPYQVVVRSRGDFICGGSILDATTVVTAGHCVTAQGRLTQVTHTVYPASRFSIGYGSADRNAATNVQVSSVSVPAAYQAPVASADESYDVAILRLATPIPFGTTAAPISLAAGQPKDSGSAFATGWGSTFENGPTSTTLQGVELPLKPDASCAATYGDEYVAPRSVCAGGDSALLNNPDTCQGDSGGPLAVRVGSDWQLLGITSYGDGCGRQNTAGVYAWTQGTDLETFITSRGADDRSAIATPAMVAAAPAPAAAPVVVRDTTRPILRYSKFSCTKKRRCTVRLRAADNLGVVSKLSVKVSRKVKLCTRRDGKKRCRTVTRSKTLKPKRVTGGFTATASFARATYTLTAVGTDASGNRSATLRRTVRATG